MSIGIYKITSPSGKIYIGQSINIEKRWKEHISYKDKKTKLCVSFKKHGFENHNFEIIEECDVNCLDKHEIYWKVYYLNLVNGDWNKVLFHELYDKGGGPKSQETKDKIGNKNKKPKPEGFGEIIGIKIIQYDLEGNFIKEWNSITLAKLEFKGDIQACCIGKQKTAGGFIWKYKTEDYPLKIEVILVNNNKNKPKSEEWLKTKYKSIIQYSKEGNFIKEWDSIKKAVKSLNLNQSGISNCCLGNVKTAGGFIWKYK